MSPAARRLPEVDGLKAAGIVTVVLIHALRAPWDPEISGLELWLAQVTHFGVPAFLCASGFLYASGPTDRATTWRRLRRILLPYLVASAVAQLLRHGADLPYPGDAPLSDLLLGSSLSHYYYVPVITVLVVLTPGIAQLPRPALVAGTAVLLAGQWLVEAYSVGRISFYWQLRNPLLWWGYFMLGWLARLHEASLRAWLSPRRRAVVVALVATVVSLAVVGAFAERVPRLLATSASWLENYAILALIAGVASCASALPRPLRVLSDATYAMYLYHLWFMLPMQKLFPAPPGRADWQAILLPWIAGVAGSLCLVAAGRRLLGPRSRDWIGA